MAIFLAVWRSMVATILMGILLLVVGSATSAERVKRVIEEVDKWKRGNCSVITLVDMFTDAKAFGMGCHTEETEKAKEHMPFFIAYYPDEWGGRTGYSIALDGAVSDPNLPNGSDVWVTMRVIPEKSWEGWRTGKTDM